MTIVDASVTKFRGRSQWPHLKVLEELAVHRQRVLVGDVILVGVLRRQSQRYCQLGSATAERWTLYVFSPADLLQLAQVRQLRAS